jgi:hypothetical protein
MYNLTASATYRADNGEYFEIEEGCHIAENDKVNLRKRGIEYVHKKIT